MAESGHVTVVISPLRALIQDQVSALNQSATRRRRPEVAVWLAEELKDPSDALSGRRLRSSPPPAPCP